MAENAAAVRIRPARPEDAGLILSFVRELAAYEGEADKVANSEAAIREEGFGERPIFQALIAELAGAQGRYEPVGMALCYHTYSTWTGRRGLYVDDLYVREAARRHGVGRALLQAAARLAREQGCTRVDLQVLDWNPAIRFYERLGFRHLREWLPYRLDGEALERLVDGGGEKG